MCCQLWNWRVCCWLWCFLNKSGEGNGCVMQHTCAVLPCDTDNEYRHFFSGDVTKIYQPFFVFEEIVFNFCFTYTSDEIAFIKTFSRSWLKKYKEKNRCGKLTWFHFRKRNAGNLKIKLKNRFLKYKCGRVRRTRN